jgi:hypothetical protein
MSVRRRREFLIFLSSCSARAVTRCFNPKAFRGSYSSDARSAGASIPLTRLFGVFSTPTLRLRERTRRPTSALPRFLNRFDTEGVLLAAK